MARQYSLVIASSCVGLWLCAATQLEEELETSIPLEAWESPACGAHGRGSEECDLHLLQHRAQGLAAEVPANQAVSGEAEANDATGEDIDDAVSQDSGDGKVEGSEEASDVAVDMAMQNSSANAAGRCTSSDLGKMNRLGAGNAPGSWPGVIAYCARRSYKWFKMHYDDLSTCISQKTGVSLSCVYCYSSVGGQYSYQHCKAQCIVGKWCSSRCLSCTRGATSLVETCAGFVAPHDEFC